MKVEAELVDKYVFTGERPGHRCGSCVSGTGYELLITARTLDELKDKLAVEFAHRGWDAVRYPSLWMEEFLEYDGLSIRTDQRDQEIGSAVLNRLLNSVWSSELYLKEVEKKLADRRKKEEEQKAKAAKESEKKEYELYQKLKKKYEG